MALGSILHPSQEMAACRRAKMANCPQPFMRSEQRPTSPAASATDRCYRWPSRRSGTYFQTLWMRVAHCGRFRCALPCTAEHALGAGKADSSREGGRVWLAPCFFGACLGAVRSSDDWRAPGRARAAWLSWHSAPRYVSTLILKNSCWRCLWATVHLGPMPMPARRPSVIRPIHAQPPLPSPSTIHT